MSMYFAFEGNSDKQPIKKNRQNWHPNQANKPYRRCSLKIVVFDAFLKLVTA